VIALAGTVGRQGMSIGPVNVAGTATLISVLVLAFVPTFTRLCRANTLVEMQEDYVSAARALGVGPARMIVSNLLPNVMPPMFIQGSFSLASAIASEAAVSFLGFGVEPPQASWGNLLQGSLSYVLVGDWWLVGFPSAAIVLAVLAFNLV